MNRRGFLSGLIGAVAVVPFADTDSALEEGLPGYERYTGGSVATPAVPGAGPIQGLLNIRGTILAKRSDRWFAATDHGWEPLIPLLRAPSAPSDTVA